MFFQLGNITFQGLFSPDTFSVDGSEATYAEHAIIGSKPRLQKTGDELEEITFDIRLHAEFCNPEQQLRLIQEAKENGTILPMLMGNGKYRGDYVIISNNYTVEQALNDGTIVDALLTLTIKEFIAYNKLEQQQSAARKAAFAIGDKNPVTSRPPQVENATKQIARGLTSAQQQVKKVDNLVSEYQNNISKRQALEKRIVDTCTKINNDINEVNNQLDEAREVANKFTAIKGAATSVATAAAGIKNLYPFQNITDVQSANTYLQGTMRTLGNVSAPLIKTVATRQPIN